MKEDLFLIEDITDVELLKELLDNLNIFFEKKKITDEIYKIYNKIFLKYLMKSRDYKKVNSIYDFIELYSTEKLKELPPFKRSKNEKIKSYYEFCLVENGRINPVFDSLLRDYSSLEDFQQKEWVKVLNYLRNEDARTMDERVKDYKILRMDILTLKPFLSIEEFYEYQNYFYKHPQIISFLKNAYQTWENKTAKLCNNCKYPMEEIYPGDFRCRFEKTCENYDLKGIKKEKLINTASQEYLILKKGFYIFTTLPTLFENYVKSLLEKELKTGVFLFPEIEAKGDIEVRIGNKKIFIDCKTKKFSHNSALELYQVIENDYKSKDIDFYVLPSYWYKGQNKKKINELNSKKKYNFVSEKELITLLKREKKKNEKK